MTPRIERALRWFVGLSLVLGGFVLVAAGVQFGTLVGVGAGNVALAGALAVGMTFLAMATEWRSWPAMLPAVGWIGSMLLASLWAGLDASGAGHAFLSGYAAIVAFATGVGFLRRDVWAWPTAFASVTGFGPLVLLLAPLDAAPVAAGIALFLADLVALLSLHQSYFEPR